MGFASLFCPLLCLGTQCAYMQESTLPKNKYVPSLPPGYLHPQVACTFLEKERTS